MQNHAGIIKAIIGLGNPGAQYYRTRHSIGFRVLDEFARRHGASWRTKDCMEIASVESAHGPILLIKPQTYMNSSGKVIPYLIKQGITPAQIVVVHDELEISFGAVKTKIGGSHRGHNGLRSIIEACGPDFVRLRCGIGRPDEREQVADYVLTNFSEPGHEVEAMMLKALDELEKLR